MPVVLTTLFSPWSAYSGGGQRSTHNLALALAAQGQQVAVVYTRTPFETVPLPDDLPYAVHWALMPALRTARNAPLRPLTCVPVARQVARLLTPGTVVHANGEEAALLPRLKRHDAFGLVVTPRYSAYPPRPGIHFKYRALGQALRGADLCCPPSRRAADLVAAAYGLETTRMQVVHNGVPAEFLAADGRTVGGNGPLVFCGRFARDKGIDVLLEALDLLGASRPQALIVGRGPEARALRRRLARLGPGPPVELRPWMEQQALRRLLQEASMAVVPSRAEAFGLSVVSAMAVGAPVVASAVGGIPEIVAHGRTGLLVPPGDAPALAAAIAALKRQPAWARDLGAAGRRHVRRDFTWARAARTFAGLYEEILRRL